MDEHEKVTVKPTWQLAWGLWWRTLLINLGIVAAIIGIMFAVGMASLATLLGFFSGGWPMP